MIIDNLGNSSLYATLAPNFKEAFHYLKTTDFTNLKPGKYEIQGEDLFVVIQEYNTKDLSEGAYEAHKKYADIQFMVSGMEQMFYNRITNLSEKNPYKEEVDAAMLQGEGFSFTLRPSDFAIFFPEDGHMPGIKLEESSPVKKVVVKIKL